MAVWIGQLRARWCSAGCRLFVTSAGWAIRTFRGLNKQWSVVTVTSQENMTPTAHSIFSVVVDAAVQWMKTKRHSPHGTALPPPPAYVKILRTEVTAKTSDSRTNKVYSNGQNTNKCRMFLPFSASNADITESMHGRREPTKIYF